MMEMEFEKLSPPSWPRGARREQKRSVKPGLNCLPLLPLLSQGFFTHSFFFTNISYFVHIPRDLTTSPASSYKPYLKFSVNAILSRGEDGEEEEEERKPLLRRNEEGLRSPSPSLSPQPPPYSSSSPPLSPIVTQVRLVITEMVAVTVTIMSTMMTRMEHFLWKKITN